ncbi:MAG: DUF115 domain-containing protein [Defluviitaleaceae bacterium]|nr:DUF115 domain-containing protein [Defluviitaleaceae bacterium]
MENAIFEKNLEAAARAWPLLSAEELRKQPDTLNCLAEDCINAAGEKTLLARYKGNFIHIHSKYDPSRAAEGFARHIPLEKKNGALILCGMGFGYEVREYLRTISEDNRIIVCEPDYELLRHAFRSVDLTGLMRDGRVFVVAGESKDGLAARFRERIGMYAIDRAVIAKMPAYWRLYGDRLDAARDALLETAKYFAIIRNSISKLSETWYLSHFRNWKTLAQSCAIDNFFGLLEGKPAVLVSAGPSLNKNVGLLNEIKGKVFILCVYTALKVLEKRNIRPDMVIALDGRQIIYRDFANYAFDMPLIYCSSVNPDIFGAHSGKTVAAMTGNDGFTAGVLSELGVKTERVQTGESVACAALDILCKMGAGPVIFIGQDFAYSGGKNHADGTFYDGKNGAEDVASQKFPVEAWDGGQVLTDDMWYVYLEWFGRYIREDGGKRTFVDATEGGALIRGTERMTFRQAIKKYRKHGYDVESILKMGFAKGPLMDAAKVRMLVEKLAQVRADLEETLKILGYGIGLSEKLEKLYEETDSPDSEDINEILKEFGKVDEVLERVKHSTPIMDVLFMKSALDLNAVRAEGTNEGTYAARRSHILYKSLLDAAEFTLPLIDEAQADLESVY